MDRYICIHGHFYQPPRENPWLEAIEIQDSARPYHDWNERIAAECYAPNAAARILDGDRRITDIVSNYAKISFNFGPTVLSWMEKFSPDTYQAVVEADRISRQSRGGHGAALAQAYNHMIMPLANSRDKRTQIAWGIRDFERRFGRAAEGMWLPETAADLETLDLLAEQGMRFTILAPHQASRVRKRGTGKWKDVSGAKIDPTRAYLLRLPSGRSIALFFYDGPISQSVAFEKLLLRGEDFANRLLAGFNDSREWEQMLHIATDGETYGHHQKFGDMALAYALHFIETGGGARLTNYAEYLESHPPTHEAEIFENTSWSCFHGVERWRGDCGCNSGGRPGWNQKWRAPLREALDWLRDELAARYEEKGRELLKDPWQARDDYIDVILDRSREGVEGFLSRHAARQLGEDEVITVFKLLELQRHAMLMYTSCGWFFDELSGIETVQVIQYAGRAIQLSEDLFPSGLEQGFLERLAGAKSNLPEMGSGAEIYERFVKPAMIDLKKVGVHYAVSSLFEEYGETTGVYSYSVRREDFQKKTGGRTQLAIGNARVASDITGESERISFAVLHLGDHALNCGARTFLGDDAYGGMKAEMIAAFEAGALADIVRMMDKHFGMNNYSVKDLFRDEQRKILGMIIGSTLEEFAKSYRTMYDDSRTLMGFLKEAGMPPPKAFRTAAEFTLNHDLAGAFGEESINIERIREIAEDIMRWNVALDASDIEYASRRRLEAMMDRLQENPSDETIHQDLALIIELLNTVALDINYWQIQNSYLGMMRRTYGEYLRRANEGDEAASRLVGAFSRLGQLLRFNTAAVLPES